MKPGEPVPDPETQRRVNERLSKLCQLELLGEFKRAHEYLIENQTDVDPDGCEEAFAIIHFVEEADNAPREQLRMLLTKMAEKDLGQ